MPDLAANNERSTIAAVATAPGQGGIGVVRLSGPDASRIAQAVCGRLPAPRMAAFRHFRDRAGQVLDEGLCLWFPGPASYTGEDVVELQGHGGPVVLDLLLGEILSHGARPARPGEFSERAFLNGRLDLAQAEAVADLIESGSAQAARAAMRSLQGVFSDAVDALVAGLTDLRVYVEAAIDFPEEEIDFLADESVLRRLDGLAADFAELQRRAGQGRLLREGITMVIAGRPNAGKSSLLNALAGYEAAIVTDVPGTTRDLLRERIQVDGMPLHVIDTAGLHVSEDRVEREGMRRAREEIARADHVLVVLDDSAGGVWPDDLPAGVDRTVVYNKVDVTGRPAGEVDGQAEAVAVSAKTAAGLEALHARLKSVMGYQGVAADGFTARRRHLEALDRARSHLERGRACLEDQRAGELLAEELRLAQRELEEITGAFTSDDLLGRIFSSFCIGK
ncbi:MAG: tRNA uridine-5-carboxymethylaminomethyl(34) synthesis GTPase MnmE [Gammaproteobacteria bacterium]